MFLSKSVALLRNGKVASCHCQIDEYSGWCLFKCWIMFVVFPDLYYDPTNPAELILFFNLSSTPMCFCHRLAELFTNKNYLYDFGGLDKLQKMVSLQTNLTGFDLA